MAIKGRQATFEERLAARRAMENGTSAEEIVRFLSVSRSSAFEWQKAYRAHGANALADEEGARPGVEAK